MKKKTTPFIGILPIERFRENFGEFLSEVFENHEVECKLTCTHGTSTICMTGGNVHATIQLREITLNRIK